MKKTRVLAFGLSLMALAVAAGCASQSATTRLPDGQVATRIDCGRNAGGLNFCFEQAGKSCGAEGYRIVTREGRVVSTGSAAEDDSTVVTNWEGYNKNSILILCGEG